MLFQEGSESSVEAIGSLVLVSNALVGLFFYHLCGYINVHVYLNHKKAVNLGYNTYCVFDFIMCELSFPTSCAVYC